MLIKIDKIIESHEHLPEQNVPKNVFFLLWQIKKCYYHFKMCY